MPQANVGEVDATSSSVEAAVVEIRRLLCSQIAPTTRGKDVAKDSVANRVPTVGRDFARRIVVVTASCIGCPHPPKVRAMSPFDNEPFGSLVAGLDHRIVRFE
jgi:hypothetical protein